MTKRNSPRKARKPAIVVEDDDTEGEDVIAEDAVAESPKAEPELDDGLQRPAKSTLQIFEPNIEPEDGQPDLRLPAELVIQVLELLAAEGQLQTIGRLAMGSKQFYRLAQPLLVRDLRVGELASPTSDAALDCWLALFTGVTSHRLQFTRSLELGYTSTMFLRGRLKRVFDAGLSACANIESLDLVARGGIEPDFSLLSGLTKLTTLKITLGSVNGPPHFRKFALPPSLKKLELVARDRLMEYTPRDSPLKIIAAALPAEGIEEFSVDFNHCWHRSFGFDDF
jgi:hypothetical protein